MKKEKNQITKRNACDMAIQTFSVPSAIDPGLNVFNIDMKIIICVKKISLTIP